MVQSDLNSLPVIGVTPKTQFMLTEKVGDTDGSELDSKPSTLSKRLLSVNSVKLMGVWGLNFFLKSHE